MNEMNAYTLAHRGPSRSWVFSAADCLKYDAVALSVAVDAADDDGSDDDATTTDLAAEADA